MVLHLTGQNVTRSFELPGKYSFYLTVTDGMAIKTTKHTNCIPMLWTEIPKEEVTANATSMQHN